MGLLHDEFAVGQRWGSHGDGAQPWDGRVIVRELRRL